MYIKQIISVHPRSSCTIFCAKCGTALLKIRPFEGFAPQLYPENPKMRYSSTQAPYLPPLWLSHLPPPHLPHLPPPRLPRFLPPSQHLRLPPAVHRACDSAEREGNRRRTEEPAENRRRNGGKTENRRRNGGKTENRRRNGGKTENRRRN